MAASGKYMISQIANAFGCRNYSTITRTLQREIWRHIKVDSELIKKAQRILGHTPKKTPAGMADIIRQQYVKNNTTAEALAIKHSIAEPRVYRILYGNRKDITTTHHLQSLIDQKRRSNVGKHNRALNRQQYSDVWKLQKLGWTQQAIGDKFGVHRVAIKNILQGKSYKKWYQELLI